MEASRYTDATKFGAVVTVVGMGSVSAPSESFSADKWTSSTLFSTVTAVQGDRNKKVVIQSLPNFTTEVQALYSKV